MDSLIEYRGYMLEDGTINRSANEYPDKIVIRISNFNFNESTKQLSIKYAIRCFLEETEMISLGYRAWFTISSDKFIKEFNERKDSKDVYKRQVIYFARGELYCFAMWMISSKTSCRSCVFEKFFAFSLDGAPILKVENKSST